MSAVSVVFCQVDTSVTSWQLVHGNPTESGASSFVISKPFEWADLGSCSVAQPCGTRLNKAFELILSGECNNLGILVFVYWVYFKGVLQTSLRTTETDWISAHPDLEEWKNIYCGNYHNIFSNNFLIWGRKQRNNEISTAALSFEIHVNCIQPFPLGISMWK